MSGCELAPALQLCQVSDTAEGKGFMGTKVSRSTIWVAALLIASGCGMSGAKSKRLANTNALGTTGSGNSDIFDSSSSDSSDAPPTVVTGVPPREFTIRQVGYRSYSVTVRAKSRLRIKFAPGVQDRTVSGTGFTPQYSKLGVYVYVGSVSQATPMLSNGFSSEAAQESGVMDFSGDIPSCGSSATCRSTVTIKIDKPNTDYWCLNWNLYCPYAHQYDTHPWNGVLTVETDDTDSI